jgi:hypothetical protein
MGPFGETQAAAGSGSPSRLDESRVRACPKRDPPAPPPPSAERRGGRLTRARLGPLSRSAGRGRSRRGSGQRPLDRARDGINERWGPVRAKVAERLRGKTASSRGACCAPPASRLPPGSSRFTSKEELIVKLPAARVDEPIAKRRRPAVRPSQGPADEEWVRLAPADEAACTAYVIEARNFVPAQVGGRQKERRVQWQRQQ